MDTPTKHIRFSWIKSKQGRLYKTMLGLLGDKDGFNKVKSGDESFNSALKRIIKETNSYFPAMFRIVRKYYKKNGRKISRADFKVIAMGRITMLFGFNKDTKEICQLNEHPCHNKEKFKKAISRCKLMIEKKEVYHDIQRT